MDRKTSIKKKPSFRYVITLSKIFILKINYKMAGDIDHVVLVFE